MKPDLIHTPPYGCLWCGTGQDRHGRRWAPALSDTHSWEKPDSATVLDRMLRRRADRLAAEPTKYHATTAWAADATGESGEPYCADCKNDGCRQWIRIQDRRLNRLLGLAGINPKVRPSDGSGGWGGDLPW